MTSTHMRALTLTAYGSPLLLGPVSRPEPAEGQVLVRIKASGVNPLDLKIAKGQAAHARHPLPAILGIDVAGIAESVGAGVTNFKPGDEVYGMTGGVAGLQGSLAEFVAADAKLLAPKPKNLDMREAAALPLIFITAWEGLVDRAQICRAMFAPGRRSWFMAAQAASVISPSSSLGRSTPKCSPPARLRTRPISSSSARRSSTGKHRSIIMSPKIPPNEALTRLRYGWWRRP